MQKAFDDFVGTLREELRVIDNEFSPRVCNDLQHSLCQKKVRIYERFTSGLIENAAKYLEIIHHLESELKNTDSSADCNSDSSSSSPPSDVDDKFNQIDLNYLKELLGRKVCEEKRALQSLRKLETTLMSLRLENRKLSAEKSELEKTVIESQKMTPDVDDTGAINIAKLLTQENDQLRQIITRNEFTLNSIGSHGTPILSYSDNADCMNRLEELQRQLNDKEKIIADLKESIAKKNETKSKIEEIKGHRNRVHRLVCDESKNITDDSSLSESESNDNNKLNLLMEGHRQLSALVKEKYAQLRQQRAEIKSLKKKLEEYEKKELKSNEIMGIQARNLELNNEVQQQVDQTEDHKRQLELANQREAILARKISIQTDHIRELLEERATLIRVNNEILETIAVCKHELAKYNV